MPAPVARSILDASPYAERVFIALALLLLAALLLRSFRRPAAPEPRAVPDSVHREGLWLGAIVLFTIVTRTIGWNRGLNAPFWFAQYTPVYVAKMLKDGAFWQTWRRSLTAYQVTVTHDSAWILPVSTAFQAVLGPSLHLPVLVGAFFGVLTVVFAWAFGRAAHSPRCGLLFAAFVAVSPLQLVWSRIGGLVIAAVMHVALVLWLSYAAGKRAHVLVALLAGLAVSSTVYHYYAARIAIPLGVAALIAGLSEARVRARRAIAVTGVFAVTLVAVFLWIRPPSVRVAVWPTYGGYVGNRGEQSLRELVAMNAEPVLTNVKLGLQRYFLVDRAGWEVRDAWLHRGMDHGGLCLLPVGMLGIVGLASVLRHLPRQWLWALFAFAALAAPMFSFPNARRFTLFDLAWCGLASLGTIAILRSRLFRGVPARVKNAILAGFFALLGGWSFASMVALNAVLPEGAAQPMPFGESGFNDGITCLRCLHAAYGWRDQIARNDFVVLFDNDIYRENRTSPGGLPLYGKLAALTVGRERSFVEFYALVSNFDFEPPVIGHIYDGSATDFAAYLARRLDEARPEAIVWHFERPTAWERWLAARLERAGGALTTFPTPLSTTPGISVRTPWTRRDEALAIFHELARSAVDEDRACVEVAKVGTKTYGFPPLGIAGAVGNGDGPPEWVVTTWSHVGFRDASFATGMPVAARVELRGPGAVRAHVLMTDGLYTVLDLPAGTRADRVVSTGRAPGSDCAAQSGEDWWLVDPTMGTLATAPRARRFPPAAPWIGVGGGPGNLVMLASADQSLVTFDAATGTVVDRVPAAVWPSRRVLTGECTPVIVGDGWTATFNNLTSLLAVYATGGRARATVRLDRLAGIGSNRITAVGAAGSYLGVGYDGMVETYRVAFRPECLAESPRPPAP